MLNEPGTSKTIKFKVTNVGNQPAQLGSLSTTNPNAGSGIQVTWPTLNDVILQPGQTSAEYSIVVLWNPAYPSVTDAATFSAEINYIQAP